MKIVYHSDIDEITFVPEDDWDVFNLGKIAMKIEKSRASFTTNSDNKKNVSTGLSMPKQELLNFLLLAEKVNENNNW